VLTQRTGSARGKTGLCTTKGQHSGRLVREAVLGDGPPGMDTEGSLVTGRQERKNVASDEFSLYAVLPCNLTGVIGKISQTLRIRAARRPR
jgi:hypothetical protein